MDAVKQKKNIIVFYHLPFKLISFKMSNKFYLIKSKYLKPLNGSSNIFVYSIDWLTLME